MLDWVFVWPRWNKKQWISSPEPGVQLRTTSAVLKFPNTSIARGHRDAVHQTPASHLGGSLCAQIERGRHLHRHAEKIGPEREAQRSGFACSESSAKGWRKRGRQAKGWRARGRRGRIALPRHDAVLESCGAGVEVPLPSSTSSAQGAVGPAVTSGRGTFTPLPTDSTAQAVEQQFGEASELSWRHDAMGSFCGPKSSDLHVGPNIPGSRASTINIKSIAFLRLLLLFQTFTGHSVLRLRAVQMRTRQLLFGQCPCRRAILAGKQLHFWTMANLH